MKIQLVWRSYRLADGVQTRTVASLEFDTDQDNDIEHVPEAEVPTGHWRPGPWPKLITGAQYIIVDIAEDVQPWRAMGDAAQLLQRMIHYYGQPDAANEVAARSRSSR